MVRNTPSNPGDTVRSLFLELRSHMPQGLHTTTTEPAVSGARACTEPEPEPEPEPVPSGVCGKQRGTCLPQRRPGVLQQKPDTTKQ